MEGSKTIRDIRQSPNLELDILRTTEVAARNAARIVVEINKIPYTIVEKPNFEEGEEIRSAPSSARMVSNALGYFAGATTLAAQVAVHYLLWTAGGPIGAAASTASLAVPNAYLAGKYDGALEEGFKRDIPDKDSS